MDVAQNLEFGEAPDKLFPGSDGPPPPPLPYPSPPPPSPSPLPSTSFFSLGKRGKSPCFNPHVKSHADSEMHGVMHPAPPVVPQVLLYSLKIKQNRRTVPNTGYAVRESGLRIRISVFGCRIRIRVRKTGPTNHFYLAMFQILVDQLMR